MESKREIIESRYANEICKGVTRKAEAKKIANAFCKEFGYKIELFQEWQGFWAFYFEECDFDEEQAEEYFQDKRINVLVDGCSIEIAKESDWYRYG